MGITFWFSWIRRGMLQELEQDKTLLSIHCWFLSISINLKQNGSRSNIPPYVQKIFCPQEMPANMIFSFGAWFMYKSKVSTFQNYVWFLCINMSRYLLKSTFRQCYLYNRSLLFKLVDVVLQLKKWGDWLSQDIKLPIHIIYWILDSYTFIQMAFSGSFGNGN